MIFLLTAETKLRINQKLTLNLLFYLYNIVEQKYYTSISTYKFEGYDLLAPSDYDYILTKKYGDYMTFPSPEKRVGNHFVNAYKYE
jgi:phosphorylcholine metabolism protein LicD